MGFRGKAKMSNNVVYRSLTVLMIFTIFGIQIQAQDKKVILKQANGLYYSFKDHGFSGLRCIVEPNWKKLLEDNSSADYGPLNLLELVSFSVSVDKNGISKVEPLLRGGGELDKRIVPTIGGLQQIISGFYQTWTNLIVTTPFPEGDDAITLKEEGGNYRVIANDNSDSQYVMSKDLIISEMSVSIPNPKVTMRPKYSKTDRGLLLTGLDFDINNNQTKVHFDLQYQEVDGYKLPTRVAYQMAFPNGQILLEMSFSKYQVSK